MDGRLEDGSAGDANYGAIGTRYSQYRQPEPASRYRIHGACRPPCVFMPLAPRPLRRHAAAAVAAPGAAPR